MDQSKSSLFKLTEDKFTEFFGPLENCKYALSPASLMFLGDHTHYNEGVLLSTAVNKYVAVIGRKRKDEKILYVSNFADGIINLENLDGSKLGGRFPEKFILNLFSLLKKKEILKCGLEICLTSEIQDCFGLGSVAAHQIALLKLINKLAHLELTKNEIVDLSREAEMIVIGKISNEAHHWTALSAKPVSFVFTDLRTKIVKNIPVEFNSFEIVIIDTEISIPDAPKICSERIEECEIGAKTLKLYMWGIKNLRDISDEFLQKKIFTLPKRVYQRLCYNVHERTRVEEALKCIFNGEISEFGKIIFCSHKGLSSDYSMSCPEIDFIAAESMYIEGVVAAKMISCSPKRSLYAIVNKGNTDNYISKIAEKYLDKYGKVLNTQKVDICCGVKLFSHFEEVLTQI
jgi:galactokinase